MARGRGGLVRRAARERAARRDAAAAAVANAANAAAAAARPRERALARPAALPSERGDGGRQGRVARRALPARQAAPHGGWRAWGRHGATRGEGVTSREPNARHARHSSRLSSRYARASSVPPYPSRSRGVVTTEGSLRRRHPRVASLRNRESHSLHTGVFLRFGAVLPLKRLDHIESIPALPRRTNRAARCFPTFDQPNDNTQRQHRRNIRKHTCTTKQTPTPKRGAPTRSARLRARLHGRRRRGRRPVRGDDRAARRAGQAAVAAVARA